MPWAGAGLAPGVARGFFGAAAGIGRLMAGYAASRTRGAWHVALGTPVSALILVCIVLRSVALTLRRGGIVWRDSFYPLVELRRHRV